MLKDAAVQYTESGKVDDIASGNISDCVESVVRELNESGDTNAGQRLRAANYAINWSLSTGRVSGSVAMQWRSMPATEKLSVLSKMTADSNDGAVASMAEAFKNEIGSRYPEKTKFTGTDAEGREWLNGVLQKKDEPLTGELAPLDLGGTTPAPGDHIPNVGPAAYEPGLVSRTSTPQPGQATRPVDLPPDPRVAMRVRRLEELIARADGKARTATVKATIERNQAEAKKYREELAELRKKSANEVDKASKDGNNTSVVETKPAGERQVTVTIPPKKPEPITWTSDAPGNPLHGRTLTGGYVAEMPGHGTVVKFDDIKVNGKYVTPTLKLSTNPGLKPLVEAHQQQTEARRQFDAAQQKITAEEDAHGVDTTYGPTLTYQYDPKGSRDDSNGSSMELPLSEKTPEVYERRTRQSWANSGSDYGSRVDHDQAWNRIQQLASENLARLPDNEFVQKDAWLAGVAPMPKHIAQQIAKGYERTAKRAEKKTEKERRRSEGFAQARATGKPVAIDSWAHQVEESDNSLNIITEYALPDGTTKRETTRTH